MSDEINRITPPLDQHATPVQRVRFFNSILLWENRRRRFNLTHTSVELASQALAATEATGDPIALALARFLVGFALLWSDSPDQAIDQFEQALHLSARLGHAMYQARSLAYLGIAHRRRLSTKDAERTADQALDAATAANTPEYEALARTTLAWVAACKGDNDRAREHANAALNLMTMFPYSLPMFPALALWPLIAVALTEDDIVAAAAHAEQLLDPNNRAVPSSVAKMLTAGIDCHTRDPAKATRDLSCALELADGITITTNTSPTTG
jgi:tetratricopeptide (TPR) repeat protein